MPDRHPTAYDAELALLVERPPSGSRWLHELKLDGYRMGILLDRGRVRLMSRRGTEWTADFPEVIESARRLRVRSALLDGEVVVLSAHGISDFQALQNRARTRGGLVYFAFDLLELDGEDLTREPLETRKARLHDLLGDATGIIRYTQHFDGDGEEVLRQACALGAEGIVSKRRDAPYHPGARHPDWQKTKCIKRQEFVVGGFTEPSGSRQGLGSILVGYYEGPRLVFAGKVGTGPGWNARFGLGLRKRLDAFERQTSPFDPRPSGWLGAHAHWVEPRLVVEVEFTEWTAGEHIRHPSLQGFRRDKRPREVVKEMPVAVERTRVASPDGIVVERPDDVVYPSLGVTKEELLRLYIDICGWALPHVAGRPLTLVRRRQPITRADALRSQCAFVHHTARDQRWAPEWMPRVEIAEQRKRGEYLWVESSRDLLALVAEDIVEWHVWNARADDVEHPDRIVFDLDPGAGVAWTDVLAAARLVRARLAGLDLESWVKTTGGSGRGLHVVAPFRAEHDWDAVFEFARAFAASIAGDDPERYTVSFAKADRRGRVLVDYKRNYRTSIAVAGFSTRARPQGTMSVPLRWSELTPALDPDALDVRTIRERLRRLKTDPWAGYWRARQRLTRTALRHVVNGSR